ncbi:hypothetical protein O3M35_004099 [Rhynocoris fuscipes]|uniref:Peptidase M24 domain-containing protein n=1 Tax=Rhynocoris fuscipes TaxID=488301 RepID=A0AAW1CII8_9HEMI
MLPPAQFPNKHKFEVDKTILYHVMSECRVIKSPYEIEMIRQACALSCIAHRYVMLRIHECRFEYQAESLFMHACYFLGGSRTTAYTNNCSSGSNCSILHYGDAGAPNDKRIYSGEICLFDMGASVSGYASDITISFPASAKFTPSQKIIYNAVLSARDAVLEALKPGVSWVDMHKLANRAMFKALVDADILRGDVEDMLRDGLAGIFQPHGLGHLLGIDVHDVGGYLDNNPPRPEQSWLKNLRTARVLEENCVLTVEPGCYFIEPLLAKAFNDKVLSKYFNDEKIQAYRGMGGVRIEDVVAITETGCQVLSSDLPRTVDEIERWMDLSTGADLISVQDVIVETVRKRKLEQIPAGTKILFDLKN